MWCNSHHATEWNRDLSRLFVTHSDNFVFKNMFRVNIYSFIRRLTEVKLTELL